MDISKILTPEHSARGLFWTRAWSLVSGGTLARRFPRNHPPGIVNDLGQWTGKVVVHPERLDLPLRTRKPQVWAIWGDLGHEGVSKLFRVEAMDVMSRCPQHIFLIVTKRPQSFLNIEADGGKPWPPNIWFITTAKNKEQVNKRYPIALQIPAAVRIALVEPNLGPVNLEEWIWPGCRLSKEDHDEHCGGGEWCESISLDGVICGGETGPHARPMHPDWPRKLRDDCQAAGVPFFLKSLGEWAPFEHSYNIYEDKRYKAHKMRQEFIAIERAGRNDWMDAMNRIGKEANGRSLDGRTWDELPK